MIFISFYAVIVSFSHFFNDEIIVCDIIFFFISLIYFVILKNFLKQFFKICIVVRNSFFYAALLFYSFDHKFLYTFVIR